MITTDEGDIVDLASIRAAPGLWYLGSPYTRYPGGLEEAFLGATRAAAWLADNGVAAFSPIVHSHVLAQVGELDPLDHALWMALDEPLMDAAHGLIVVMMCGWEESYGVGEELRHFRAAGKPILFLQPVGEP